jgi:hypothetical protein
VQIILGVALAAWMWRELGAYSARQRLQPREVAVIVASGFVVAAALAVTAAFGREELGTGLLLVFGAGAIVAAALRSHDR